MMCPEDIPTQTVSSTGVMAVIILSGSLVSEEIFVFLYQCCICGTCSEHPRQRQSLLQDGHSRRYWNRDQRRAGQCRHFFIFLITDGIYHKSSHKKFNVATTMSHIQYPAWYMHVPGFTVVRIIHYKFLCQGHLIMPDCGPCEVVSWHFDHLKCIVVVGLVCFWSGVTPALHGNHPMGMCTRLY